MSCLHESTKDNPAIITTGRREETAVIASTRTSSILSLYTVPMNRTKLQNTEKQSDSPSCKGINC